MFYRVFLSPSDSVCFRRQAEKEARSSEGSRAHKEQTIQSLSKLLCFPHAAPAKGRAFLLRSPRSVNIEPALSETWETHSLAQLRARTAHVSKTKIGTRWWTMQKALSG